MSTSSSSAEPNQMNVSRLLKDYQLYNKLSQSLLFLRKKFNFSKNIFTFFSEIKLKKLNKNGEKRLFLNFCSRNGF